MATYGERMRAGEAFKRGFYYGLGLMFAVISMQVLAVFAFLALASATGVMNRFRAEARQRYGVEQDSTPDSPPVTNQATGRVR